MSNLKFLCVTAAGFALIFGPMFGVAIYAHSRPLSEATCREFNDLIISSKGSYLGHVRECHLYGVRVHQQIERI